MAAAVGPPLAPAAPLTPVVFGAVSQPVVLLAPVLTRGTSRASGCG
jgi:hypothetical protein